MYKNTSVFSISLIAFIFLFSITASAQNAMVKPKITKAMIRLLDDIAKGSENSQSAKHTELLVKMGNNIDGFVPLINKYRIPEQRNILVEVLRFKGLAKSTETLVIKGKLVKGELKEADLIKAIQSNSRIRGLSFSIVYRNVFLCSNIVMGSPNFKRESKMEGKKEFYKKVEEALKSKGYGYYDGDRDIPGKGRQHANKPDFIAVKGNMVFIGEIKSPAEGPKSASWRQIQNSDTEQFSAVRTDVAKREKAGLVLPEIGGHEIIISGQIADYVRKIGINFDLPASLPENAEIMMAYSMPETEARNVGKALANCGKKVYEKIDIGNDAVTFIFAV